MIPFWAFLERVERLPLTVGGGGAGRPGPRERRLASVRNTVGAVASLSNVSTPLGRARAWIRQCLVCKCLESCVAALLEEDRLVKVCRLVVVGARFFFGLPCPVELHCLPDAS